MNSLRKDINAAINSEGIEGIGFVRLHQWRWVIDAFANAFLERGVLDLEYVWLWEHFKKPCSSHQPEDPIGVLKSLLEPARSYWFIATDEDAKYWVLQGTGDAVVQLLSEMNGFEYYLTDKEMSWFLCETHHGAMLAKGPIEVRLQAILDGVTAN